MDLSLLPDVKKKKQKPKISIITLLKYNLNTISEQTNLTFLFKNILSYEFKWTSFQIVSKIFLHFKNTLKIQTEYLVQAKLDLF